MILVDTSVWVEFFRGSNHLIISQMEDLINDNQIILAAPVRIELLNGARKSKLIILKRVLDALPLIIPTHETWIRIEEWIGKIINKGHRFGFADLLIASLSIDAKASIWSLDVDFTIMKKMALIK